MNKPGDVIDVGSVDEALSKHMAAVRVPDVKALQHPCDFEQQTKKAYVTNTSVWTIEICLCHLKSSLGLEPPYVSDSGVMVVAVNEDAYAEIKVCERGGRDRPIAADWCEWGGMLFYVDSKGKRHEKPIKYQPPKPPAKNYWPEVGLSITPGLSLAGDPDVPPTVEILTTGQPIQLNVM